MSAVQETSEAVEVIALPFELIAPFMKLANVGCGGKEWTRLTSAAGTMHTSGTGGGSGGGEGGRDGGVGGGGGGRGCGDEGGGGSGIGGRMGGGGDGGRGGGRGGRGGACGGGIGGDCGEGGRGGVCGILAVQHSSPSQPPHGAGMSTGGH